MRWRLRHAPTALGLGCRQPPLEPVCILPAAPPTTPHGSRHVPRARSTDICRAGELAELAPHTAPRAAVRCIAARTDTPPTPACSSARRAARATPQRPCSHRQRAGKEAGLPSSPRCPNSAVHSCLPGHGSAGAGLRNYVVPKSPVRDSAFLRISVSPTNRTKRVPKTIKKNVTAPPYESVRGGRRPTAHPGQTVSAPKLLRVGCGQAHRDTHTCRVAQK